MKDYEKNFADLDSNLHDSPYCFQQCVFSKQKTLLF